MTVSATKARARFFELLTLAEKGEEVVITYTSQGSVERFTLYRLRNETPEKKTIAK